MLLIAASLLLPLACAAFAQQSVIEVPPAELLAHAAIVAAPVEDIIANATSVEDAQCLAEGGHVSAVRSGDETLVLIADYTRMGPAEVTVRLPVDAPAQVVDLLTREVVGTVEPGAATITTRIEGAYRSRAFYVGDHWEARRPE